jgi:hypothetical protein
VPDDEEARPLWKTATYFAFMVGILVFANWGKPDTTEGIWFAIWSSKWNITSLFAIGLGIILVAWFGIRWWKMALVGTGDGATWALVTWGLLPHFGHLLPGLRTRFAVCGDDPVRGGHGGPHDRLERRTANEEERTNGSRRVGDSPSRSRRCCSSACWWPVSCSGGPVKRA